MYQYHTMSCLTQALRADKKLATSQRDASKPSPDDGPLVMQKYGYESCPNFPKIGRRIFISYNWFTNLRSIMR